MGLLLNALSDTHNAVLISNTSTLPGIMDLSLLAIERTLMLVLELSRNVRR